MNPDDCEQNIQSKNRGFRSFFASNSIIDAASTTLDDPSQKQNDIELQLLGIQQFTNRFYIHRKKYFHF